MLVSREKKIEEAVRRMEALGINKLAVEDIKDGKLWISDNNIGLNHMLDLLPDSVEQEYLDDVKAFEDKYNAMVYHIIKDNAGWTDLLYVSDHEDEWEYDHEDIYHKTPIAYVMGWADELGSIGVKALNGIVFRTA